MTQSIIIIITNNIIITPVESSFLDPPRGVATKMHTYEGANGGT